MEEQSTVKPPALQLKELLDKGSYRAAYKLGAALAKSAPTDTFDAHFWFQYALAAQLAGKDPALMYGLARDTPGYTSHMEGDILRDAALMAIRLHRLDEADQLLQQARNQEGMDDNQYAASYMTEARIEYARGHYASATSLHAAAQTLWDELGEAANQQWVRNNRFHWFMAATMAGKSGAYAIGSLILKDEPNERRQRLVHWADRHGRLAVVTYGVLERLGWRVKRLA